MEVVAPKHWHRIMDGRNHQIILVHRAIIVTLTIIKIEDSALRQPAHGIMDPPSIRLQRVFGVPMVIFVDSTIIVQECTVKGILIHVEDILVGTITQSVHVPSVVSAISRCLCAL